MREPLYIPVTRYRLQVHVTPITDDPDWQSIQLGVSLIRAEAIDVIHAHLPNAHSLAGILSK